eukprot:TRINITY_DN6140_c0_g1_i1.p1 TRINITY_DN6140_c0_g1~~TRINITY_DN6140_c0_g1_i1.p1  ORF type:complete len:262 (-),score=6.54 TRINITY_DN6140_c0_g1_i1:225-1010(-)
MEKVQVHATRLEGEVATLKEELAQKHAESKLELARLTKLLNDQQSHRVVVSRLKTELASRNQERECLLKTLSTSSTALSRFRHEKTLMLDALEVSRSQYEAFADFFCTSVDQIRVSLLSCVSDFDAFSLHKRIARRRDLCDRLALGSDPLLCDSVRGELSVTPGTASLAPELEKTVADARERFEAICEKLSASVAELTKLRDESRQLDCQSKATQADFEEFSVSVSKLQSVLATAKCKRCRNAVYQPDEEECGRSSSISRS